MDELAPNGLFHAHQRKIMRDSSCDFGVNVLLQHLVLKALCYNIFYVSMTVCLK